MTRIGDLDLIKSLTVARGAGKNKPLPSWWKSQTDVYINLCADYIGRNKALFDIKVPKNGRN